MNDAAKRRQLERDIRRTLVLSRYIDAWGMPEHRVLSTKRREVVEVYSFPPGDGAKVHRFATVGASAIARTKGEPLNFEFLLVLPADLGGATFQQAVDYLLDVFGHGLRPDVSYCAGYVIPEILVAPSRWRARAALLDEPLGEPEELSWFHVGNQHVDLLWIVPIHVEEAAFIERVGIAEFATAVKSREVELIDPNHECASLGFS